MDGLTNLLDGPRGRGAFLQRTVMEPPWSFRMADDAPLGLVAVLRGTAWITPDAGEAREVGAGSVSLVRALTPLTIASAPDVPPTVNWLPGGRRTTTDGADLGEAMALGVRTWGNDPDGSTVLLMGCYQLRGEINRRVVDALPPLVVLEREHWDSPLPSMLGEEIRTELPGQQAVLDRLFDLLLVSVLRTWFSRAEASAPGWYAAHRDPVVGRALRLLHEDPARPWTVADLAAESGASRSVLARRFADLVGSPPMSYLKQWRLARTADLLLDPGLTLDSIARRVGYSDGLALSSAFKAARGVSPRQYRETRSDG
ncbi:AraC family transcriptional regulator [Pseudonocardia cypriaca]|uniref:AraC-like DNA-binding protein n=1 Tax=Pseudonocardia cypriaca TaxID=882449 RepID=A0A543FXE5_9PSEU|nr:AraC family transcriptional regulator [Pseudonocardia cypriaca]TQM38512.1 AraC-like DNA-binding protein [Pseudonocardia cypriaca]